MNSPANKIITVNKKLDYFLIYCPLWFPLIYLWVISNFPSISPFVFILSIFLFAETHFASTWLFFFDRENITWIKTNFYKIAILPIFTLFFVMFMWVFTPNIVLILHYLASGFHVTRQSIGITKISNTNNKKNSFLIYFISAFCLIIGLINPGILASSFSINQINIIIFLISTFYLLTTFYSIPLIKGISPIVTGISIYLPLLFFDNLAIATVVGVGMHWCQYIVLMFAINLRKNKLNNIKLESKNFLKNRFLFVIFYSLVMTSLTFLGMPKNSLGIGNYSFLYLIPLLFQLYHFYLDGFIWKFSDKHIRGSVSKYIFQRL